MEALEQRAGDQYGEFRLRRRIKKERDQDQEDVEAQQPQKAESPGEAGPDARIFVATDEAAFVDHMEHSFPGRILKRDMFRSQDGRPIDVVNADSNHVKGLHAVVDCLLLARTHVLIRTASNLGLAATFFNPVQPVLLLNPER